MRRSAVRFVVDAIDDGRQHKIEVSDAFCWTKLSWDQVTVETIKNCWRHTGILPAETESAIMTVGVETGRPQFKDFGNLFDRLCQALSILPELLMTPEEYVCVDSQLPTCELMTDGEIIAMVSNAGEGASSGGRRKRATSRIT